MVEKVNWVPSTPLEEDPCKKRKIINLFEGYPAKFIKQYDEVKVRIFLQHVADVIIGPNDPKKLFENLYSNPDFHYVISYLADLVQNPRNPERHFLLIPGKQGAGKSIIFKFFVEKVLGTKIACSVKTMGDLMKKFNMYLANKLVIFIEECANVDFITFKAHWDELKGWLRLSELPFEEKHQPIVYVDNYMRIAATSNKLTTAVQLDEDDRKTAIFGAKNLRKGNKTYFKKLADDLFKGDIGDHVYTWMMRDFKPCDLQNIPMTEAKEETIEASKGPYGRFLSDLKNGAIDVKLLGSGKQTREGVKIPILSETDDGISINKILLFWEVGNEGDIVCEKQMLWLLYGAFYNFNYNGKGGSSSSFYTEVKLIAKEHREPSGKRRYLFTFPSETIDQRYFKKIVWEGEE